MLERTITALYALKADAEEAKNDLSEAGITSGVDIHQNSVGTAGTPHEGFWASLKDMFGGHDDTHAYAEGLRRGNYLLTARIDETKVDTTLSILDSSNAIDVEQAQAEWKNSGWAGTAAPATSAYSVEGKAAGLANTTAGTEEVIPVIAEELRVGKREVERGGVRVRSYVVETPVSEQIQLREEHVDVERRPVNRAIGTADAGFRDRTIELTETAEEAVVAKEAFVREEVVVRKTAEERTQTISDSVRHTEVEVDRTGTHNGDTLTKPAVPGIKQTPVT